MKPYLCFSPVKISRYSHRFSQHLSIYQFPRENTLLAINHRDIPIPTRQFNNCVETTAPLYPQLFPLPLLFLFLRYSIGYKLRGHPVHKPFLSLYPASGTLLRSHNGQRSELTHYPLAFKFSLGEKTNSKVV